MKTSRWVSATLAAFRRRGDGPCRRRRPGRESGAALLIVAVTILLVGVLGATMATLCATSSREQVMAGFSNDAFCLSESGARSVIAHATNAFYNLANPGTPAEAMALLGTVTHTPKSGGIETWALAAPVLYTMADAGRKVSVDVLTYTETYDAASNTTSGLFHLESTGEVNSGSALATRVRNVYELQAGAIPGPETLLDWAVWAGHGGIETDGTPSGIDSVASGGVYNPKAKVGSEVPTDKATGLPIYTAPAVSDKTGAESVDLGGNSEIYGIVTAAGDVTPDGNVRGVLTENAVVGHKEPAQDLGNGTPLTNGGHTLTYTVGAGNVFTLTNGNLPGGTWRHDGPLVVNFSKGQPWRINGDVTLFVGGSFALDAQSGIEVQSGRLTVVVSGNMSFGTGSPVNAGGSANHALFFGTATCTSVSVQGCPTFVGVIYAPMANIVIGGNSAVLGSVCGNTVSLNGSSRVTFDNSLADLSGGTAKPRFHTEPTRHLRSLVVAAP